MNVIGDVSFLVGHYNYNSPSSERFIEACKNSGIPHVHDLNTAKGTLGVAQASKSLIIVLGRNVVYLRMH